LLSGAEDMLVGAGEVDRNQDYVVHVRVRKGEERMGKREEERGERVDVEEAPP
jgi:hypothetical protein